MKLNGSKKKCYNSATKKLPFASNKSGSLLVSHFPEIASLLFPFITFLTFTLYVVPGTRPLKVFMVLVRPCASSVGDSSPSSMIWTSYNPGLPLQCFQVTSTTSAPELGENFSSLGGRGTEKI